MQEKHQDIMRYESDIWSIDVQRLAGRYAVTISDTEAFGFAKVSPHPALKKEVKNYHEY